MLQEEIEKSLKALQENKLIVYPTDTVWGIGCDATSKNAVAKVYKVKQREESKALIILVNSIEMLQKYILTIPSAIIKLLHQTNKPTTIIYSNPVGLAKNLIAADNTIAIRIVKHKFCEDLIEAFGKPIVSTSANISGKETPKSFEEIDSSILESVDYVVNLQRKERNEKSSTILKIDEKGEIIVLRN